MSEKYCRDCMHWTQITNWKFKGHANTGICGGILYDKVEITTNPSGQVETIETEELFGCNNHKTRGEV